MRTLRRRMDARTLSLVAAIILAGMEAIGCGDDAGPSNHAPNVLSLTVVPENPAPGDVVPVRYNVEDVDGDPVSLRWETTGGSISMRGGVAYWIVPDTEGTYRITLFASDGSASDAKSLDVLVWEPRPGNYYPLAVGNEWHYIDGSGNTVDFRLIDTIQIEHTDVTSYVLETTTSDPGVPEGIANYSYVGRAADGNGVDQHAVNVVFGSPETLIFDPWLPLYRFPLIPGKKWSTKFKGYIGEGKASYRVVDESSLTTPAGTFEHVFQVEETFEWTLIGEQLDKTVSRKWLAPDVGIVKLEQEQTRAGQTARILASLASYRLEATDAPASPRRGVVGPGPWLRF